MAKNMTAKQLSSLKWTTWRFIMLLLAWSAHLETFGWNWANITALVFYVIQILILLNEDEAKHAW